MARLAMRNASRTSGSPELHAVFDAVGGSAGTVQQLVSGVTASGGCGRDVRLLGGDPGAILGDECSHLACASAASVSWPSASMDSSTPAIWAGATRSTSACGIQQVRTVQQLTRRVNQGFRGDTMPDSELEGLPVVQVSDAFVPVVAFQAPQVRPGDERLVTVDLQLGLEREGFIAELIGLAAGGD